MATVRSALQMPGELNESRVLARVTFLGAIPRLRPHIVTNLWDTALVACKLAVIERFYSEIFEGIDLEEFFKENNQRFRESPKTCGDYFVHLIQKKLSPHLSDLATPPDPVRHEFFSFHTLTEANTEKSKALANAITGWSHRWNLDAEWCRDHALKVLLAWLFNRELRWVGVFPSRLRPVQFEGWRFAVSNLENDGLFSRVLVEFDMERQRSAPKPFRFVPSSAFRSFGFETQWNVALDSEAQFKKNARCALHVQFHEAEINRLKLLKKADESISIPVREFERRLAGRNLFSKVRKEFEAQLANYISKMNAWKRKTKKRNSLIEVSRGFHSEHQRWLVLYQIPGENGNCMSQPEIVWSVCQLALLSLPRSLPLYFHLTRWVSPTRSFLCPEFVDNVTLTIDSCRKIIEKSAKLISLKLRDPHSNAGRPPGPGKKKPHRATN